MIRLLLLISLLISFQLRAEEEPEPEYPYPKTKKSKAMELEKPAKVDNRGVYYYKTDNKKKKKKTMKGVEAPYKIGSDGTYYYGDEDSLPAEVIKGVEKPIDSDSDGSYYYSRERKKKGKKNLYGPQPTKVHSDGSHSYNVEVTETKNTFYLRGGVYGPPDIQPVSAGGSTYKDVYGTGSNFIVTFEYDWLLTNSIFLKLGSGFTSQEGEGQFSTPIAGVEPRETFQFYIFPTTLSVSYKFQLWNIQYLTPYVEGGLGYFAFVENRSDGDIFSFNGETTKYGGAFVTTATAGLLISLSIFQSGSSLQSDYGATQTWLDIQYKQILGLDSRKDFSSNMITGGFAVGF